MATKNSQKSDPAIDTQMVMHVAYLVRLGVDEDEARAFSQQFSVIIDHFRLLNELDTSLVPPAFESPDTHSVLRPDEVQSSMPRQDFMKNVPHRQGDYVQVPPVFGEE